MEETTETVTTGQLFGRMIFNPPDGYRFVRDQRSIAWLWLALLVIILTVSSTYAVQRNLFAQQEAAFLSIEQPQEFEIPPPTFGVGQILPIALSPIGQILIWLVWAAGIYVFVSLFGGRTAFGKMWQLAVWGSLPLLISLLLNTIYLLASDGTEPLGWSVANFVTNPIPELGPNPTPDEVLAASQPETGRLIWYGLAERLDLFIIWQLLLLIIGTATIGRIGMGKSIGIVLSLWAIGTLIVVIPSALFASGAFF